MPKGIFIKVFMTLTVLVSLVSPRLISPAAAPDLSEAQVMNGRYLIPGLAGGARDEWVQLKDGEYRRDDPNNPLYVKIVAVALGHLSNKKTQEAAVIYGFRLGGTGFFMQICAVVNDQGQLRNSRLVTLEDRTKINSLNIESGKVVVDMLVHASMDPASFPTLRRISKYALVGDNLMEKSMVLPRTGKRDTSLGTSPQALYLRQIQGLAPFDPTDKFLAANFVTQEMDPPYIFGTVKDFAASLKYPVNWLIVADEKNRHTYGDSPEKTGDYFVYLEEDRPDKVAYYVFADQSGIPPRKWPDCRRSFFKNATDEQYAPARAKLERALKDGFPVGAELSFIEEDGTPLEVPLAKHLLRHLNFAPLYDLSRGRKFTK